MSLLEIEGLRVSFTTEAGKVRALEGVCLDLEEGATLGLVGESGSGKSVTCLSILGLLGAGGRIEGGSIRFEGKELVGLAEHKMRRLRGDRIAMVFQDPMTALNPFLTVGRQVSEVLEIHLGLSRGEARRRALELLKRVGLAEAEARFSSYPFQLSGGMRQRVMIAMALACRPRLLLADEPTTALDVTLQAQILDLIGELRRETGSAVVLVTHDLGVVAGAADRVAVMYAGRTVEQGPVEEIFAHPAHPYTQGLLGSLPRLEAPDRPLSPIPGLPPDLSRLPSGCPFHPRCPRAVEPCREAYPATVELGGGHRADCREIR